MKKTLDMFNDLPMPKTNNQEVLLTLILQGKVSIFDYAYMSGFRTRVSNLKLIYGIGLDKEIISKVNKHGNTYTYALHKLPDDEKEKAIEIYKKMHNILDTTN